MASEPTGFEIRLEITDTYYLTVSLVRTGQTGLVETVDKDCVDLRDVIRQVMEDTNDR